MVRLLSGINLDIPARQRFELEFLRNPTKNFNRFASAWRGTYSGELVETNAFKPVLSIEGSGKGVAISGVSQPAFPHEAPAPGCIASNRHTFIPTLLRCSAVDSPIKPAPTTIAFLTGGKWVCTDLGRIIILTISAVTDLLHLFVLVNTEIATLITSGVCNSEGNF